MNSLLSRRLVTGSMSMSMARSAHTIGFVGIGNMGANMARNLMKAGNKLVLFDLNKDSMAPLVKEGAIAATSVADLSQQVDRVVTMLPTPDIVKKTFRGPDGIMANAKKGSILMDSSTVGPDAPRELRPEADALGLTLLDTPVTGAVPAAAAGTLTFLVGGTEAEYLSVKDLLLGMGKNVVHCGGIGAGQVAKICNNMCLAINMISTAETIGLAKRLGIEHKLMTQILNISSGRSWCSEIYNPAPGVQDTVPSSHNYDFGFQVELITKDLSLVQHSATSVKQPLPLGGLAYQTYLTMLNNGHGRKDFSFVYKYLEDKSGK